MSSLFKGHRNPRNNLFCPRNIEYVKSYEELGSSIGGGGGGLTVFK